MYVCMYIRVARYTDVTVRYVLRYNMKKKQIYCARFLFIYFEQTVVQNNKKIPSRCENTKY